MNLQIVADMIGIMLHIVYPNMGAQVHNNHVYYNSCNEDDGCTKYHLKKLDASKTQVISRYGYIKDNKYVYYKQYPLKSADAESFRAINDCWAVDKNSVYYYAKQVKDADPKTFVPLLGFQDDKCSLAKDSQHIIYRGISNIACNPQSLRQIKHTYAWQQDDQCVYYEGKKVDLADSASFVPIKVDILYTYGKDDKHVFYGGKLIKFADPKTFKVYSADKNLRDFSYDRSHVFYRNHILEYADPNSFRSVGLQGIYQKDNNHVYFNGKLLPHVDAKYFHSIKGSIDGEYAIYKNHLVYANKIILGSDAKSLKDLGLGFFKDKNHVYFNGKIFHQADSKTFRLLGAFCAKDDRHYYNFDGEIMSIKESKQCEKYFHSPNSPASIGAQHVM